MHTYSKGHRHRKRHRLAFTIVLLAVLLPLLCTSTVVAQEEVSGADELQGIADDLSGDYVLVDDIDLSGYEFERIGGHEEPFTGTLDGDGHTVSGLVIETDEDGVGMFGEVGEDATIRDLGLESVDVRGREDVGALAGRNHGEIRRSYATGRVRGNTNTGGLVGRNIGEIVSSNASATVTGKFDTGGLVGRNVGAVRRSHTMGEVNGDDSTGGIAGYNLGTIADTYATGSVTGRVTAGGIAGRNRGNAVVRTSYATARVESEAEASALIGLNSARVENSYYDVEATGEDGRFTHDPPGTPLSTAEMKGSGAERNMEGFDFGGTWEADSGYPTLVQESVEEGEDGDNDEQANGEETEGEEGSGTETDDGQDSADGGVNVTVDGGEEDGTSGNDTPGDDESPQEDTDEEEVDDGEDTSDEGMPGFGIFVGLLAFVCAIGIRQEAK